MNAIGSCGLQVKLLNMVKEKKPSVHLFSCTILVKQFPLYFGQTHGDQRASVKRSLPIDDVVCILYVYWVCFLIASEMEMKCNLISDIKIKEQDEASYMKFVVDCC